MNAEERQLKELLLKIVALTFEKVDYYKDFYLSITGKELKSKHGQYIYNERKIELFNLTRPPGAILIVALHEMTHHIEFMDLGESGHKKSFYERLHPLLLTALSLGLIDKRDIWASGDDSADLKNLEKYFGSLDYWKYEVQESALVRTLHVTNSYECRNLLNRRGYEWFPQAKAWEKEYPNESEAVNEKEVLQSLYPELEIKIMRPVDALFSFHYYLAVTGAFHVKEQLSQAGYMWNGFGFKKAWVKKYQLLNIWMS
ncbi:hypothetical protein GQR36_27200 [Enterococcus termitis]